MTKRAIIPNKMRQACAELKISPGIMSGNHLFLTGVTGSAADGTMPAAPDAQIRAAFEKIAEVLHHGGLSFAAIVEMTTYHIGIDQHFDLFSEIRGHYVKEPFPAWTAVEVAGLRRAGAIVEIRAIASLESET